MNRRKFKISFLILLLINGCTPQTKSSVANSPSSSTSTSNVKNGSNLKNSEETSPINIKVATTTPTKTTTSNPDSIPENLLDDPFFEQGLSGFEKGQEKTEVSLLTIDPIEGKSSLKASINIYGDSVWRHFTINGKAKSFEVKGHLRSIINSSSQIEFCAFAIYSDGTNDSKCASVSGQAGDKGQVIANLVLQEKEIDRLSIRIVQVGSSPIVVALDEASATADGLEQSQQNSETTNTTTAIEEDVVNPYNTINLYPGFTYSLPTTRPFISLDDYSNVSRTSGAFLRFKAQVDDVVSITSKLPITTSYKQLKDAIYGNHYLYSAVDSVVLFKLTSEEKYIRQAIIMMDLFIQSENALINSGTNPIVASDSYLDVGPIIEQISLTYDYGNFLLTAAQKNNWALYVEQTLYNVWNPLVAKWGTRLAPWSGWSIGDPGNNYHFSFLKATMLWALASQNQTWFTFLQQKKFGPLINYYTILTGGGSREGTGYGAAHKSLFENYRYWKSSTLEDLSVLTNHTNDTIDYWIHATVPTLNYYASIGDQARVSTTKMFDYQRHLMIEAMILNLGTPESKRASWWLNNIGVTDGGDGWVYGQMRHNFNYRYDLLTTSVPSQAPVDLVYHAEGVGHLFARSSWAKDASWLSTVAGPFDQSHAHQEQGSFAFYRNGWLSATSNMLSHDGIHAETGAHNIIRFERNGTIIPQNHSTSIMSYKDENALLSIDQNLSPAYSSNGTDVQSYRRNFEFKRNEHSLLIRDEYSISSSTQAIWQLHVPTQPTDAKGVAIPINSPRDLTSGSSINVGGLTITLISPAKVRLTIKSMNQINPDFLSGYRIELSENTSSIFQVKLLAK